MARATRSASRLTPCTMLDDNGFEEVETPVLVSHPSGALARPFVSHHNSLDPDVFLRIAP